MNEERQLIDNYLDGELTPADERRLAEWLAADPEHVREFVRANHLHRQLRETMLARQFQAAALSAIEKAERTTAFAPPFARIREWLHWLWRPSVAFAGCALVLAGLAFFFFGATSGEPVLSLGAKAQAKVERGGQIIPLTDGVKLHANDLLTIIETNGAAVITYGRENTRIVISPDTRVKILSWEDGKRFELRQGRIEATVAHQPNEHPMVWRTADAEVTVVGTEFALETETNTTRLEVLEGKVRLTSLDSGQSIQLTNTQHAVAASGLELKAQPFPLGRGTILREFWLGVRGTHVGDVTSQPSYPNQPTGRDYPARFAGPANWGTNYGARFRGYLHPPKTGTYTFWIAANESAQLWLSSDERPERVEMVASLSQSAPPEQWDKYPWQKSHSIKLQAGRKYYVEMLHKDWESKNDHCSVAWQPPGGKREVISGEFLSPFKAQTATGNQ